MNSRERVFAALQGKMPDQVPVMEMFIDPQVIDSINPGISYGDFIEWADIDVVTCLTMVENSDDIEWVDEKEHIWRDKWGALQKITEEVLSVIMPPPVIETEDDLNSYIPPAPSQAYVHSSVERIVQRFKGDKAIAVVGELSFAPSQYLRAGMENLMIDYATRPDFVRKLARIGTEYHVELYKQLIKEGVEIVVLGDDYAGKTGPIMSPKHFEEYILPSLQTVVTEIKHAGGYVIKHCDGNIWPLMDMFLDTGFDMLGPLEPAYMDLAEVRNYSKGKIGVLGNVDVDLLSRGTTKEVIEATKDLINLVSPLGGHIVSSGNSISSYVKGDNFMAMIKTVKEFGRIQNK